MREQSTFYLIPFVEIFRGMYTGGLAALQKDAQLIEEYVLPLPRCLLRLKSSQKLWRYRHVEYSQHRMRKALPVIRAAKECSGWRMGPVAYTEIEAF